MTKHIANSEFTPYRDAASAAVASAPTKSSVWAVAEYLDLVDARELPNSVSLGKECTAHIKRYVTDNLKNDEMISFWEQAGCLFRAYKRALRVGETAINNKVAAIAQ